jgi:hypothetical protein
MQGERGVGRAGDMFGARIESVFVADEKINPLVHLIRVIGVVLVSSKTGAAEFDMLHVPCVWARGVQAYTGICIAQEYLGGLNIFLLWLPNRLAVCRHVPFR